MIKNTTQVILLSFVVLAVTRASPAWADDCDAVDKFLEAQEAYGYVIEPITDDYVGRTFPGPSFCGLIFRQWPIGVNPPEGLNYSNVAVVQSGQVSFITSESDLRQFFVDHLGAAPDADSAKDAGRTWLRFSSELEQDLFFTFSDPAVEYTTTNDAAIVTGRVIVLNGGTGSIELRMTFDRDGNFIDARERNTVRAGVRPICQATKLLDRDTIVRRMAERDILVMGRPAKPYLDQQRAKARPALKRAIDRIWQRILDEGR